MFYRPNDNVMSKLSCIHRKNKNIKDRILYGPNGLSPIATGTRPPSTLKNVFHPGQSN